ncbi:hypothetical protein F9B85_00005 [Heliorestis acidaminivorans]|uniref:Uncharacterized protein n=1 Tax=Heliorestis acidaminivorans TaxID=553427 RepID=A0A6I0ETK5_9FIRM|nr:hypothetical protein [Heliorestis acidaminivorans]KAB2954125.1 hypothetical protein F9B85_00005 [Heliorestis acidaminivorans]
MISDEFWVKVNGKYIGASVILMLIGALVFGYSRIIGLLLLLGGAIWLLYEIVKSNKEKPEKVKPGDRD